MPRCGEWVDKRQLGPLEKTWADTQRKKRLARFFFSLTLFATCSLWTAVAARYFTIRKSGEEKKCFGGVTLMGRIRNGYFKWDMWASSLSHPCQWKFTQKRLLKVFNQALPAWFIKTYQGGFIGNQNRKRRGPRCLPLVTSVAVPRKDFDQELDVYVQGKENGKGSSSRYTPSKAGPKCQSMFENRISTCLATFRFRDTRGDFRVLFNNASQEMAKNKNIKKGTRKNCTYIHLWTLVIQRFWGFLE